MQQPLKNQRIHIDGLEAFLRRLRLSLTDRYTPNLNASKHLAIALDMDGLHFFLQCTHLGHWNGRSGTIGEGGYPGVHVVL